MKPITRRLFLKSSTVSSAAVLLSPLVLPGCAMPADGTFERPYTAEDPGQWVDKVDVHQPRVYAAIIDPTLTRLWVEVQDAQGVNHEQTAEHYVSRIIVLDQAGKVIANAAYNETTKARVVMSVALGPEVTEVHVYEQCNLHGFWRVTYPVDLLKVAPVGDERRALTPGQPGEWADKIAGHMPIATALGAGAYRIEVGDRAAGALHVMTPEHFINEVVVLDQNGQELARQVFAANVPEPAFTVNVPATTTELRVIAGCNLHQYWEGVFVVTA